jgi:hypothetical protein
MSQTPITSSLSQPTAVKKLDIVSNKDATSTSLLGGLSRLEYFESILQDTIRAEVFYADTGNAVNGRSVLEALPLVGTEEVKLKLSDNLNNNIDLTLYVNKVTPFYEDTTKSLVNLSLVSEEFITNEMGRSRLNIRFDGKISDTIEKILTQFLKTTKKRDIETTSNNYNFIGNNRKPFYTINWLSKKSVSTTNSAMGMSAGYFLFETTEGYKFKSIDTLFAQKQKKSFIFTNTSDRGGKIPAGYDGKILSHRQDNRIQAQEKYQIGAFGTRLVTFDPFNCFYDVKVQTSEEAKSGVKLAGKELPKFNDKFSTEELFTRTTYMLIDKGTLPTGDTNQQIEKSQLQNFDVQNILNQSIRRYNQVFSNMETITIAADFSLHAGDAIYIDIPSVQQDKGSDVNRQTGGLYIIAELCHYISPRNTFTKLNLIRDSFGRKGNHTTTL